MMPTRAEAEKILEEAEQCNSGPWVTLFMEANKNDANKSGS